MAEIKRLDWIDLLRALAIILVVYGHCSRDCHLFFLLTSPVKMPLFFAISAFLFKDTYNTLAFFKGIFFKLIVPWIFLGIFPVVLQIPVKGPLFVLNYFIDMIKGNVIWFMPCFIIAQILHFFIKKLFKRTYAVVIASIMVSSLGFVLAYFDLGNFAMFNRALVVQAFYLVGFLYKREANFFSKIRSVHLLIGCFVYLLLCVLSEIFFPGKAIDVHLNNYYNIPLCFVQIYLGTFLLFVIAPKIKKVPTFMNKIGQNTLVIYIWHGYFIGALIFILNFFNIKLDLFGIALLKTIFACFTCCCVSILMNRYLPFLIGKSSRK